MTWRPFVFWTKWCVLFAPLDNVEHIREASEVEREKLKNIIRKIEVPNSETDLVVSPPILDIVPWRPPTAVDLIDETDELDQLADVLGYFPSGAGRGGGRIKTAGRGGGG